MSEVFNYFWGSVDVTHPISGDVSWKFTGFEEVFCVYKKRNWGKHQICIGQGKDTYFVRANSLWVLLHLP